ncbi:MAG: hypothetical protein LKE61_08870 [Erysipelotrichaceae bacterium]|jgi:hypothetical protein|nr:hypothetical protein [Erysipelotrichaceae bacterium]MCI1326318.1 hypothetical protein [Solobacterium sp.]MCH4044032.1 hypothetical protein [Erysipelotrichaceae bacterium]MCH4121247.1 hypothetical protein [Erysipelotrichaceae bacterium]MCI1362879.1 hypothetical protein [Solobacterium sp.]
MKKKMTTLVAATAVAATISGAAANTVVYAEETPNEPETRTEARSEMDTADEALKAA